MNHNEYSQKILDFLTQKYKKEFEIVDLIYEVDGDRGSFYRAICKEKEEGIEFISYCYLNGTAYLLFEETDETISSPNKEVEIQDDYCECVLGARFAKYFKEKNIDALAIVAEIGAINYKFTLDDIANGFEYCLSNSDFDVRMHMCVLASNAICDKNSFEKNVIEGVLKFNSYYSVIDFAYAVDNFDEQNSVDYASDVYSFEESATNDYIVEYNRYLAKKDGKSSKKVIKGA
ncbi:MAG: hypothetical protein E7550_02940 [Ruminococcaceae bacterium]|nr:hypothetical protein [Oscillospiraceae bacterium]